MLSQWDCLLKNLGEWQGSFTRLSARGEEIEDTPTVVTLAGKNNNQTVHQVVRYLPLNEPSRDLNLEYSSLNNTILFFENGAFSQGSMQLAPYSNFGSEFGLINGDRRLRMVQLYNTSSQLDRIVLIREQAPQSKTPERPVLTIEQLLGQWQGEAVTMYRDLREPDTFTSELKIELIESDRISQKLSFGDRTITSQARIENSRLLFETSNLPIQILMLPDGASCNCPLEIKSGHKFVLEMGWLLQPNLRQRIIRNYDEKGGWVNCTLVTERKVS